jgi:hypothetical protein
MRPIERVVRAFDGQRVGELAIAVHVDVSDADLDRLVELSTDPDEDVQTAATWLLKAHLEDGVVLGSSRVAALCRDLQRMTAKNAKLHVCQSLGRLAVPARNAEQVARFLRPCATHEYKFLRAWAADAWHRLAGQHPSYIAEAVEVLDAASHDPAASVRARVRNIAKERA